jgi:ParB family chromosome partitioning protein
MAFDSMDQDTVVEVNGAMVPVEQGEAQDVPLPLLFLSVKNVRKTRNPETIPTLAATILAQGGLLAPLCVVPERLKGSKVKGDTFGVVAGGRRLAALLWLVEHGKLAKDSLVKCLVFKPERAVSVSLTENTQQEAMHPADQLEAFKALVAEGKTAGEIAASFGVSVQTVERRLALANLAPMFIELFRAGNIRQDQLQALALTSDHSQQLMAWEALPSYDRSAHRIRKALTTDELPSTSPLARFVTVEAYRAAGGAVREDLFSEDSSIFLQDVSLLNTLAVARLEAEAETLRDAGWKWVEVRLGFTSSDLSRFSRLQCTMRKPSQQETEAMADLKADLDSVLARMRELQALTDYDEETEESGEWTESQQAEFDALDAQSDDMHDLLESMGEALRDWKPGQRAASGVVIAVDSNGSLSLAEGLVRPEDKKQIAAAGRSGAEEADEGVSITSGSGSKERAEYSAALCQNLTAHRTAAVAACLSKSPKVALAALLHALIATEREPWQRSPLGVRFDDHTDNLMRNAAEFELTPASVALKNADTALASLPGDSAALFAHLQAMELPGLLDLLARSVAHSYSVQSPDPVRAHGLGFDPAQGIEAALNVNMAEWWNPTMECWLGHVSKAKMMEAVTESVGAEAARPIEKMKKGDAIDASASMLEGRRWLPSTLRPYPAPVQD